MLKLLSVVAATTALLLTTPAVAQQKSITLVTAAYMNNGGLDVIMKGFEAETGVKVTMVHVGMDTVAARALAGPTDAMFMPPDLMDGLAKQGAEKPGSRKRVGRSYMGLAVQKGAKIPDISTVPKLAAALNSANLVMISNPGPGTSRTAQMITDMFKRPEFATVKTKTSPYGDGGSALARNEGDMAIQNISQIIIWDNTVSAGPLPEELGMYIDAVGSVSTKSKDPVAAQQFVDYATQKGLFTLWWSRGVDMRKGAN